MLNKAIAVGIPPMVYLELNYQLRKRGDPRPLSEVVTLAINSWLSSNTTAKGERGYQWKELFVPDGCLLRLRYRGEYYYAKIDIDKLIYAGEIVSPRDWTLMVTGTVCNAWRDIWIQRNNSEAWSQACAWRSKPPVTQQLSLAERRCKAQRRTDQAASSPTDKPFDQVV